MKKAVSLLLSCLWLLSALPALAQQDSARIIREQMQKAQLLLEQQQKTLEQLKKMGINIDPKKKMSKAEAEQLKQALLKNAQQEAAGKLPPPAPAKATYKHATINISQAPTQQQVLAIVQRFFNRSYPKLTAAEKTAYDNDYKMAATNKFSPEDVRRLSNKGSELMTFGTNHHIGCVYLAAAVKAMPADTLSINNFGGYLRIIDSVKASLPVLLYAHQLYGESPIILTQIGSSLLELNDDKQAEKYLKMALQYDPAFGQAHTALCEVYIRQNRLQEALAELFAGVRGMGASYRQASQTNQRIEQAYADQHAGAGDFESKAEFWEETNRQLEQAPATDANPLSTTDRVAMPKYADCERVEDWALSGGHQQAARGYQAFMEYLIEFAREFNEIHQQLPELPENAVLRDYPAERFALERTLEMLQTYSAREAENYQRTLDNLNANLSSMRAEYLNNYTAFMEQQKSCLESCPSGDETCLKECFRKYCLQQCPNAKLFNDKLRIQYSRYRIAFSQTNNRQIQLLDRLYSQTAAPFSAITSPYWSRIYAYEIKRVALAIVGNAYMFYPQYFDAPINDPCGEDCSIYTIPFKDETEEVNKQKPSAASECPEHQKAKIPLAICELGLDCESIEFGCTEILSGAVKRNFKKKSTTLFVGVGLSAKAGIANTSIKAGVTVSVNDNDDRVDIGGKFDASANLGVGPAKVGAYSTASYTLMKGFNSDFGVAASTANPVK